MCAEFTDLQHRFTELRRTYTRLLMGDRKPLKALLQHCQELAELRFALEAYIARFCLELEQNPADECRDLQHVS